jgi:hypothetical protein
LGMPPHMLANGFLMPALVLRLVFLSLARIADLAPTSRTLSPFILLPHGPLLSSRPLAAGGELPADRQFLAALKQYQAQIMLADDEAAGAVRDAALARVQASLEKAIECVKRRQRVVDYSDAMTSLRTAIDFNRAMTALRDDAEVSVCMLLPSFMHVHARQNCARLLQAGSYTSV